MPRISILAVAVLLAAGCVSAKRLGTAAGIEGNTVEGTGNTVATKSTIGLLNIDYGTAAAGAAGYAILGHPVRRAAYRVGGVVIGEWLLGLFKRRKKPIETENGIVTTKYVPKVPSRIED